MSKNVMVDIESLSTTPQCAILSIGACTFDNLGLAEEFYCNVSIADHREVEPSTLLFWFDQVKQGIDCPLVVDALPLKEVLLTFETWLIDHADRDFQIWANGITFDISALEDAWRQTLGTKPLPWKYNSMRDARTVYKLLDPTKSLQPPLNIHKHHALEDAKWQAEYLIKILNHHDCWE